MLHNKKGRFTTSLFIVKKDMPKESVKRNHVVQILRKRISEFKLKEDNTMRINGFSGTNTQTGTMGMTQGNDSVSKNIQNQIANAQQKLQDLSSNEEMSLEDKMKKASGDTAGD